MGSLLDALSQENLDNQRDVVKNEKRWSYDNRPYGTWNEKLLAHLFPPDHPYHHPTIGSMADLDAASLDDVSAFFRTYYVPNNAVLSVVGDCRPRAGPRVGRSLLRPDPAQPRHPGACRDLSLPPTVGEERRETVTDRVPLPRIYVGLPGPRVRRPPARRARPCLRRCCRAARAAGYIAGWSARSGSPRTWPCSRCRSWAGPRQLLGWATARPGIDIARVEAGPDRGARAARRRATDRRRAGPGQGADRGRRAGGAGAGRGAGRPPVDVRDAVR